MGKGQTSRTKQRLLYQSDDDQDVASNRKFIKLFHCLYRVWYRNDWKTQVYMYVDGNDEMKFHDREVDVIFV